jgi:polyferredoxin
LEWKLDDVVTAIQAIQGSLAPAVMITGVALLLVTFSARHSSIVNRIRLLNNEKRGLEERSDKKERLRRKSIDHQLELLLPRLKYVRNGILCHMLAIIFFVLTSLLIGLGYTSPPPSLTLMINGAFIGGMLLVLGGVIYLALELFLSYRVIIVEVREA